MGKAPILIVDDSPANLKVARVALEAGGYEVRTAADGEEAWRLLGSFKPSSILMDLQLPGLDGFELTQRIKSDPELQHIPIIAVTAYAMKGDRERALAVGCDDYIAKPVDPIALPALVATHLHEPSPPWRVGPEAQHAPILVIEDNPTTRKLIRVALEGEGFRAWEAGDGQAALRWIESHRPVLIVQDLMLPDLDGLELARQLRATPNGCEVPILCLSGFLARMDKAKAMASSFAGFLVKPIDPMQLIEAVRRQLAESRPPAIPADTAPHVLFVDDDPLQRRLGELQLTTAGLRVSTVASAKQALALAARNRPDVILSDVLMPEMDGFELCLAVRHSPQLAGVPVILISSNYTDRADRELAQRVGANALVTRTVDCASVIEQVEKALEQRPAPSPLIDTEQARVAILRRTAIQLARQLLAKRRVDQQCQFQAAQLSVLARIADALTQNGKLDDALGEALSVCLDLAGISKGVLYVFREGVLVPRHRFGFAGRELDALSALFGEAALFEQIVAGGQVVAVPSPALGEARAEEFLTRAGVRAALIVPVGWADKTYGALLLGARTAEVTDQAAVAFARVLGCQLGQAIGIAESFERLHASEERFRALVDSMDDVTVVDREQRISGVHGRRLEREGVDPRQLLGKTVQELMPHDHAAHDEAHARALAGASVSYEWSLADPDARHFECEVFPMRDPQGRVSSLVRVARDVTQQKHLQAHVMVSDRMASVGMLAAGVAHEINSPLMAVLSNLSLALEDYTEMASHGEPAPADLPDLLHDAFEAAQRVEAIVRDLRLFSRAEDASQSTVDVHEVLDSTLRMARNEIRHRARLLKEFGHVPPVHANASRLGQVFLNLLLNAAQAIPDGRADENEIRIRTGLDARGRVLVEISDTGVGVPAELHGKLFTPFVTSKPAGVGTGLGLAICQRIVTALGGEIAFESRADRGTVFRVHLPADPRSIQTADTGPAAKPALRRGSVMIIDDDAALCSVLGRALSREHDVVCSTDAREALQILSAGASFDVILCDVMMPHMTGAEFFRELARLRSELVPRTVFLTGGAFTPAAREFVERLGPRCLEKPLNLADLHRFINDRID